ncbi:TOMM precursor leader peptide-binding protein [Streptomyces montanisoli]|uniref:TOMM leader peptide-binding protein n=1 Tax=Streptomyces montanisoli TaxID=2798581 RepID=A0A940MDB0_9ACTN|nr:TOMM precursor leader peptide-binding protein [Streptomyces montanisoli]MBP0456588.1 TOMM precursor leader peptide-binding protein [Streptomyces montanisoli]
MTSYRLNPHLRFVRRTDDEVLISRGSRSIHAELLRDDAGSGALADLLERLRDPADEEQLTAWARERRTGVPLDVPALLAHLLGRGVLVPAGDDPAHSHLRTSLAGGGDALRGAVISIVGDGVLATTLERQLAASGIVTAGAVPRRVAQPSPDDVADELFADAALVVVALDRPESTLLHALNDTALRGKTPWLPVCLDGGEGVVGPTHVPGESACHLEFELQTDASVGFTGHVLELRHAKDAHGPAAVPPPHQVEMVSGLAVEAVIAHLAGTGHLTSDRAVRFDFERMEIDYQDVLRLPRCPACGPQRAPYRNPFL